MTDIVEIIRSFNGLYSLGSVNNADVEKAANKLSVSFAPDYKAYTMTFGAIAFGGKEFTGVVQPEHLNVVSVTNSARKITPNAKPDWYVVMDPHYDGIIIWQDENGQIYQTEPGKEPQRIAESLADYMKEEV